MACYTDCFTEATWITCKCFPFYLSGQEEMLHKVYGLAENKLKFCDMDGYVCMRALIDRGHNRDWRTVCPRCKIPCFETFYETEISSKTLVKISDKFNIHNATNLKRNFVAVNFHFQNMNLIIVEEYQAISFRTLAVAVGWTLSLFLGSSFVTPTEILYYIILTFHHAIRKYRALKRVGQVPQTSRRRYSRRFTVETVAL